MLREVFLNVKKDLQRSVLVVEVATVDKFLVVVRQMVVVSSALILLSVHITCRPCVLVSLALLPGGD